jgi:K319L-like, PKD domain
MVPHYPFSKLARRLSSLFSLCRCAVVPLAFVVILLPTSATAFDITLAWDRNTEPDLAGYRVFARAEGDSYDYGHPDWEGTGTTCTLSGLLDGTSYYFVARAFDTAGNVSGNSNEVFFEFTQNTPPNADAGPNQTVNEGQTVTLDGSNSSDPDGAIVEYQWAQTVGRSVSLSDSTSPTPRFTAPLVTSGGEALTFALTVTDDGGSSDTDTVIINVSNVNQAPIANAGPDQSVGEGGTVKLNGSNSSDPDGTIVSYRWSQKAGVTVTVSNLSSAQPTFIAPDVGPSGASLTFALTVTDNGGLQSSDECIVNVSWVNLPPTPNAGPDQTVSEGDTVSLDGSSSMDPDDSISSYLWSQTAGTSVTLSDPTSPTPWFRAPSVGLGGQTLTFQLRVTDTGGLSATDTVIINVSNVNQAPIADAGPDQTVDEGDGVTLDGSASYDPEGAAVSYRWSQTAGPAVTLSNPLSAQPSFVAPAVGPSGASLTFALIVTDNGSLQATDTCTVGVSWVDDAPPAPPAGLRLIGP